jgi:hypothetical protein
VVVVVGVVVVVLVVVDVEVLVELELVVVVVGKIVVVVVVVELLVLVVVVEVEELVVVLVELLELVVVVVGCTVVLVVVVGTAVVVVVVVHSFVFITTMFGDTLRATIVLIQTLDSPCKVIVSGSPVLQLPIKNDSAEFAVLYNKYDLQVVNVLVLVVVGFNTTSTSQDSSKQRSGSLHLLTHPAVRRITLLAIICTEYLCA